MRKVRVLCVGKKQEAYLKTGIEIYQKKLRRYCDFELLALREANYGKGSIKQWHKQEQEEITNKLRPQTYVIACDEGGKSLSSALFAKKLEGISNQGLSRIDFIVGGPYGLPPAVKNQADLILSFSSMTLTHQMIRLFLVEQIYRGFTILNGEKYHH